MRRFQRFRITAVPILCEIIIPIWCFCAAFGRAYTTKPGNRTLNPSRYNCWKSLFLHNRCSRFTDDYTWHNFRRPFRRRAAKTPRPPLVACRARKPHIRTRFNFEGEYVGFIMLLWLGKFRSHASLFYGADRWARLFRRWFNYDFGCVSYNWRKMYRGRPWTIW